MPSSGPSYAGYRAWRMVLPADGLTDAELARDAAAIRHLLRGLDEAATSQEAAA